MSDEDRVERLREAQAWLLELAELAGTSWPGGRVPKELREWLDGLDARLTRGNELSSGLLDVESWAEEIERSRRIEPLKVRCGGCGKVLADARGRVYDCSGLVAVSVPLWCAPCALVWPAEVVQGHRDEAIRRDRAKAVLPPSAAQAL